MDLVEASPISFTTIQLYSPLSSGYAYKISRVTNPNSNEGLNLDASSSGTPFLSQCTDNFGSLLGATRHSR